MKAAELVFASVALLAVSCVAGADAGRLTLAERGKQSEFSVVLPPDPTESERFAAEELRKYVHKLTGVRIGDVGPRKILFVRAEKELGPDGFRLRFSGEDLELSGGRYGLLYAVYEILETYGGIEWFSPECEVVPNIDKLELPEGYTIEWGGQLEKSQTAQKEVLNKEPIALIIMAIIVVALFNGMRQPVIIAITFPLAMIGITFGLLVMHQAFGFMALVGAMSLLGMMVRNGVVL